MPEYARPAAIAAVASLLIQLVGCGASDDLPREAVSGTITVDGKPLPSGLVTFLPEGSEATQGGGPVADGKYAIPRDQGLVPGKYKVSVSAVGDTAEKSTDSTNNMPGMPPAPAPDALPKEYNTATTLSADVAAGAKNVFDFNLTTAKRR